MAAISAPPSSVLPGGLTSALDPTASDDQTGITWHDPMYPHVLNRFTVMHYFELSPFFDRNSNNMIARRKNLDPAAPGVLDTLPPGIEYVVELDQGPNLFVIRKQLRRDATNSTTLALYYVLDRMVYQAPTLYAALSSRVRRCLWNLQEGFARLKKDLDPLLKLAKADEKRRQQQQQAAAIKTEEDQTAGAGPPAAAAATPSTSAPQQLLPSRRKLTNDEVTRWRKSDNIVMHVLSKYPLPQLPPEYTAALLAPAGAQAAAPAPASAAGRATEQQAVEAGQAGAGQAAQGAAGSAGPAAKRARH